MLARLVMLVALSCGSVAIAADRPSVPQPQQYAKSVLPLLKKYCFECHGGKKPDGKLRLDVFPTAASLSDDRKAWDKVRQMLRSGKMPPEDEPRPKNDHTRSVVNWIDQALVYLDCSGGIDPGRVTIRRLNRVEYQNTIRDLIGVEFKATKQFPADDVGYGFDNIGDVLSLSPILMEKYLTAAEQIADRAIVVDVSKAAKTRRIAAGKMKGGDKVRDERSGGVWMPSNATVSKRIEFPRSGKYLLRSAAYGQQAGKEPARMALSINGKRVTTFDVKAVESDAGVYEYKYTAKAGSRDVALSFVNDFYDPKNPDRSQRDRNLAIMWLEVVGPLDVKPEDYPASHRKILFVQPSAKLKPDAAALKVLKRLASRAFRRPTTKAEAARLMRLWRVGAKEGGFAAGIQLATQAVLISPHFLFRIETDPQGGAIRTLSEFELATRMSYFLWSTMPDKELFDHAWKETLRKNLAAQVGRMLKDPKARSLTENFAGQWLQLRLLAKSTPDKKMFRQFDESLRSAMRREAEEFFASIVAKDRSVLELLDADYTYLNERLARHYGIAGVKGKEFRRVSTVGQPRGGVLTMASVLTVTSDPNRTSPVKRGKWVMENILGTPPPPPPPDVPKLDESSAAASTGSLRKRLEAHRSNPRCSICHRQMDALGFGLENFDAIGAWRTRDGKFAVDASGDLPDGAKFSGPAELKKVLVTARRDDFIRCFTEKMVTYALGRGVEYSDRCAIDRMTKALADKEYRMSALVLQIIQSDPFQKRRGQKE
jgi:hypothetical protein